MYLAVMYLSTAFDSVNWHKLWRMLIDMGLDNVLVNFLHAHHEETYAKVRYGPAGELTSSFPRLVA